MEGIILRRWELLDVDNLYKYANNKKIADNLRNSFPYPYTRKDAEDFIHMCMNTDTTKNLFFTIDVGGEAIGSIGLFLKDDVYCKSAELGYWLAEPFWGKGIMTKAIEKICEIGFRKFDIIRIYAEPYSHNTASRRALEKAGFTLEGVLKKAVYKNGMYQDSCIYAILYE
jgi:ribosomal-protein-alanine N-acetyltransferase